MKAKRIRTYYGIFLSVLTCVVGAFFVIQSVRILAGGNYVQGAYTRENVVEMLFPVSITFYVWIAAILAGFILSLVYPYEVREKNKVGERVTLHRLSSRMPQGEGGEYENGMKAVKIQRRNRLIAYLACGALCLAGAIASLVYLLMPSHFPSENINSEMLSMLINVGPWLLVAFAGCIGTTLFERYSMNAEINALKALIMQNKGKPALVKRENAVIAKIKAFFGSYSKYILWGIRGVTAVLGVTFLVLGIFNEGVQDVLIKAINICTECIGLG